MVQVRPRALRVQQLLERKASALLQELVHLVLFEKSSLRAGEFQASAMWRPALRVRSMALSRSAGSVARCPFVVP
jgi:hypothetical protein